MNFDDVIRDVPSEWKETAYQRAMLSLFVAIQLEGRFIPATQAGTTAGATSDSTASSCELPDDHTFLCASQSLPGTSLGQLVFRSTSGSDGEEKDPQVQALEWFFFRPPRGESASDAPTTNAPAVLLRVRVVPTGSVQGVGDTTVNVTAETLKKWSVVLDGTAVKLTGPPAEYSAIWVTSLASTQFSKAGHAAPDGSIDLAEMREAVRQHLLRGESATFGDSRGTVPNVSRTETCRPEVSGPAVPLATPSRMREQLLGDGLRSHMVHPNGFDPTSSPAFQYGHSDLLPGGGAGLRQPQGGMHLGFNRPTPYHPGMFPGDSYARYDPIVPGEVPRRSLPSGGRGPHVFPGEPDPDHLPPVNLGGFNSYDALSGGGGPPGFRGPPGGPSGWGGFGGMSMGGSSGFRF